MNVELKIRELTPEELLFVSGAKPKTPQPKAKKTFEETCTTIVYSDGEVKRTCVPDK